MTVAAGTAREVVERALCELEPRWESTSSEGTVSLAQAVDGVCVPECPVDAIFPEDEVPDRWHNFTALNAEYCEVHADLFR